MRLFGEFTIEAAGRVVDLPSGRPRALLAWLALHPGSHQRSRLASRFWPDILDRSARASLRTALWRLRRALGEGVVWADRERAGLHAEPAVWVDTRAFDGLLEQARPEEALALVRGELLAGLDDDWVIEERRSVADRVAAAMEQMSARRAREGDPAGALDWARRRAALDPLDESAQRALMGALAAAGDPVGATRAYALLRERLRGELSLAPSEQTRELARAIGAGGEAAAPGGGRPEESQRAAVRPGSRRGAGPGRPRALPAPLALAGERPLVGRRQEIGRLLALEADTRAGGARTVLLTGEAGIGKTRVLAEVGAELAEAGSVILFGCAGRSARAAGAVLDAVSGHPELADGGSGPGQGPALDEVADRVCRLAEETAVVLMVDDAHHVDGAGAVLLSRMVAGAARLPLLVICAVRPEEMAPAGDLTRLLTSLERPDDPVDVALGPLDEAATDELCRRAGGDGVLSATIQRASGGNPLLALDMARSAGAPPAGGGTSRSAPIGARARAFVDWRLAAVGEGSARLLALAAVAGPSFELAVLERAWDLPEDELAGGVEDGLRAGLLVEDPGSPDRISFVHDLIRDDLLSRVGAARRRRLHARIAAALDADGTGDSADAARHWCAAGPAGDPDLAVERASAAAQSARASHRFGEAIELINGALALLGRDDPRRRALLARRAVDYLSLEHLLWTRLCGVRADG
ncbi:MAG: BTAD domain-containing putative transcriptional regulator [Acidimicrobiales bacterium]